MTEALRNSETVVTHEATKINKVFDSGFFVQPRRELSFKTKSNDEVASGDVGSRSRALPSGIKFLPDDAPPLPESWTLAPNPAGTARLWGEYTAIFSKFVWNEIQANVIGAPTAVLGLIGSTMVFPPGPIFLAAGGVIGYLMGRGLHQVFIESDRIGFGPRSFGKKYYSRLGTGHYPKDAKRENGNEHYTLGERPITKKQVLKVIDRIAELKTTDEMKKITGDPNYELDEGTGGHCTVYNGKIYIVMEKTKKKWIKGVYVVKNGERVWQKGYYKEYMKSRSKRTLAHEFGHAMEDYAMGGTGGLGQFHESHTEILNDMVRAVLMGLSSSWFHKNSPLPLDPPKELAENASDKQKAKHDEEMSAYEKKVERQKKWNYAELFAEFTLLFLTRPRWAKAHFPEVVVFYQNYINSTPMTRHVYFV